MAKKFHVVAILAIGTLPSLMAGTDMVIDNSAQAPPPAYGYAPPPPPAVYYIPPPVRVAVYPTYRYYARPVRVFGYGRVHRSHRYYAPGYSY